VRAVTKKEFEAFLAQRPLAVPDGFRVVGGYTQSRYIENDTEVARTSTDSRGTVYEIAD
jgi:hypothetical protein